MATSGMLTLCAPTFNAVTYSSGAAANWAGDSNYAASSGNNSLTVSKATATFSVSGYSVPYDGNPHTATVGTITGVCGETGATVGSVPSGATRSLPTPWQQ